MVDLTFNGQPGHVWKKIVCEILKKQQQKNNV